MLSPVIQVWLRNLEWWWRCNHVVRKGAVLEEDKYTSQAFKINKGSHGLKLTAGPSRIWTCCWPKQVTVWKKMRWRLALEPTLRKSMHVPMQSFMCTSLPSHEINNLLGGVAIRPPPHVLLDPCDADEVHRGYMFEARFVLMRSLTGSSRQIN
jgi:hypothetical protein